MDGIHDLGGMEGFGPVPVRQGDAAFRDLEDWEKRVYGLSCCPITPGATIDWFRHGVERMVPADYLTFAYFNKWCATYLMMMIDNGTISTEDVKRGHVITPAAPPPALSLQDALAEEAASDHSFERPAPAAPAFAPGDAVETRRVMPGGHTRLPRYARGARGRIIAHHGAHLLPDDGARGVETAQHLYTVAFAAPELWGAAADPRDDVTLDLWESYLVRP